MFGLDFAALTEVTVKIYHDDDATDEAIAKWALDSLSQAGKVNPHLAIKQVDVGFVCKATRK